MLREIYFRDPLDSKYEDGIMEISDELECLLGKLRMILLTNKGEVLGEPNFGMDLDKYLFEQKINKNTIRTNFYAQVSSYIPEAGSYQIDCDIKTSSDKLGDKLILDVLINNIPQLSLEL